MTNFFLDNKKTQQCHKDGENRWFSKVLEEKRAEEKIRDNLIQKSFHCKRQRTLCWALSELAKYENQKGTEAFCDYVYKIPSSIQHHPITGGGDPYDKAIEKTEFITFGFPEITRNVLLDFKVEIPKPPFYVDIEYVELAYAMRKVVHLPHLGYSVYMKVKAFDQYINNAGGTDKDYVPNKYGFLLGDAIANSYENIQDFVNNWCQGHGCKL